MKYRIQRNFTRRDAAAIKEFYKATGGLRHFPKGARNLNARDLIRLEEISRLSDDPLQAFNSETGKYLLRKMGLTKSAEGIEHLANKYGNDELAARYRRRLSSKPELKKI